LERCRYETAFSRKKVRNTNQPVGLVRGRLRDGTLNALIKIDRSDVGRILLESIAYHVKHNPGNLAHGILEIRPYAQGDCNGSTDPGLTTKRDQQIKPEVHFWPKAFAKGGACSKYLEDHRDEIGGILSGGEFQKMARG
jgi:hypothetical protein